MSESLAEAIHRRRRKQLFASRTELNELSEWPDEVARNQAIGFLRVFQSEQPLDGTLIHPNDYALAEKLAKSLEIPLPPAMPPGYEPPAYEQGEKSGDEEPQESPERSEPGDASSSGEPTEEASDAAATENAAVPAAGEAAALTDGETAATAGGEATPADDAKATASEATAPEATLDASEKTGQDAGASDQSPDEDASAEDAESAKDVTELKSFRESEPSGEAETEEKPAPPSVPEPYRQPAPEQEKVARLAKEWQVGPHRTQQIVRWLCDPFTSGSSPAIAAPAAVMQRVPKLAELKAGERIAGVVVGVAPFGVFVELGPDCNGLIHVSRLSETFVEDLHEAVQVGDVIVAWVTGVDAKRRRVALSAVSPQREAELAEQRKQRRGDGRRGGSRPGGQRTQTGGGRGPAAAGKGTAGGRRRDQRKGDRGRDAKRGDQGPRVYTKVSKAKSAPPPITEAMQKGDEPLRTFGDLMQFFQKGKEEKKPPKTKPAPTDQGEASKNGPETPETPSSVKPAKHGDASQAPPPLPSNGETQNTDTPSSDATAQASRENESPQD